MPKEVKTTKVPSGSGVKLFSGEYSVPFSFELSRSLGSYLPRAIKAPGKLPTLALFARPGLGRQPIPDRMWTQEGREVKSKD